MKRIILAVVALATVSTLTGCVNSGIRQLYNLKATPEAEVCDKTLGLNIVEAEKALNMGKADSSRKKVSGEQVKVYSKGALRAELKIAPDGKVLEAVCEPIKN